MVCVYALGVQRVKTLFQYTFSVAMCSLPVITVLLAASAEMDTVQLHREQDRVEINTALFIMSHYSAYCYTVHFNDFVTLLG